MEGIMSCKGSGKLRKLAGFFAEKRRRDGLAREEAKSQTAS